MPVTVVEPTAALVVIDLQEGLARLPTLDPLRDTASRAGRLADAFRGKSLPVVLVTARGVAPGRTERGHPDTRVFPDGFADLLPELGHHHSDHLLSKVRWGAFQDTGLYDYLTSRGVTQVVIVGVATSVGVESTARAAYDHGFHVIIATDAVTDVDAVAHENSITTIFPSMAETGTVADIVRLMNRAEPEWTHADLG